MRIKIVEGGKAERCGLSFLIQCFIVFEFRLFEEVAPRCCCFLLFDVVPCMLSVEFSSCCRGWRKLLWMVRAGVQAAVEVPLLQLAGFFL